MITVKELKKALENIKDNTDVWVRLTRHDYSRDDIATSVITIEDGCVFIECTEWYDFDCCMTLFDDEDED
jgi:hypothetical protein